MGEGLFQKGEEKIDEGSALGRGEVVDGGADAVGENGSGHRFRGAHGSILAGAGEAPSEPERKAIRDPDGKQSKRWFNPRQVKRSYHDCP